MEKENVSASRCRETEMLSSPSRGNQSPPPSPPQSDSLFHLFAVRAHANPTTCPRACNMQMNGERARERPSMRRGYAARLERSRQGRAGGRSFQGLEGSRRWSRDSAPILGLIALSSPFSPTLIISDAKRGVKKNKLNRQPD